MRRRSVLAALIAALACASPRTEAPPPVKPSPGSLLAGARAARQDGDGATAQRLLEEAIAADRSWPLPRIELAELLVAEGRDLDQGRAAIEGVPAESENPRAALVRAQLLELSQDDSAAADAYARALKLKSDPDVRLRRAAILARLGRDGDAVGELQRVREERPSDPAAGLALAVLHERAGRLLEAEAELVALAEASPEKPGGWDRLARFYARTGEAAKARQAGARSRAADGRKDRALRPLLPSRR